MLPETFAAETRFLDVSQFCHTGNIVSVSKNISFVKEKHILLLKTMLPVCQNRETSRKHVCAANGSGNTFPRSARALERSYIQQCYIQHLFCTMDLRKSQAKEW